MSNDKTPYTTGVTRRRKSRRSPILTPTLYHDTITGPEASAETNAPNTGALRKRLFTPESGGPQFIPRHTSTETEAPSIDELARPYPRYFLPLQEQPFPGATFLINYAVHLALSVTIVLLGYSFFVALGSTVVIAFFTSLIALLGTAILAGLIAFPIAAFSSVILTDLSDTPHLQYHAFLILALVNQILFHTLLLAGMSVTYFSVLCALYSIVPLLGMAIVLSLPYCIAPAPSNSILSPSTYTTPAHNGIQHDILSELLADHSLEQESMLEPPHEDSVPDWLSDRHDTPANPVRTRRSSIMDYASLFGGVNSASPPPRRPTRSNGTHSRVSLLCSVYAALGEPYHDTPADDRTFFPSPGHN